MILKKSFITLIELHLIELNIRQAEHGCEVS